MKLSVLSAGLCSVHFVTQFQAAGPATVWKTRLYNICLTYTFNNNKFSNIAELLNAIGLE